MDSLSSSKRNSSDTDNSSDSTDHFISSSTSGRRLANSSDLVDPRFNFFRSPSTPRKRLTDDYIFHQNGVMTEKCVYEETELQMKPLNMKLSSEWIPSE